VDDVVGLVFKYIKLLQDSGVQKWIFDEVFDLTLHPFWHSASGEVIVYIDCHSLLACGHTGDWISL